MAKRIAVVHKERCNPQGCGGYLCIRVSPDNRMGKEAIAIDIDKKIKINEDLCGPGIVIPANRCPFHAIDIINLPEELDAQPIHKYGLNGFRLYNLPTPVFGSVLGIIGKNGIGKSTAIKILAGVMKPNLGTDKEAGFEELLQFYKGTEAQRFFESIKRGEIKTAYKPQQVDLIPYQFKGTVRELLEKIQAEQQKIQQIAEELGLQDFLDSKVTEISGGELQRVAIAATVLKDADLYIFDEPSSFLDIKQRILVSRFIKNLAKEKTAVLVIEHDLILLDAMADLINIIYGKEACYGIVSVLKSAKEGINTFLSGYIKEENVRFRDHKITFEMRQHFSGKQHQKLTEWSGLTKTLGKFRLEAASGSISKKEIVGMLGENGIGKTSFMKILAGVLQPDSGTVDRNIRISYKPQYLEATDALVSDILKDAMKRHEHDIVKPLELEFLMNLKASELSGGELQRVAIAEALAKDCELVLLDEPSAYLDIEQRLVVSKVIKNVVSNRGISAMVIDHDLLFLDYLSDRLLVFEGKPAQHGSALGPFSMEEGMNRMLSTLNITMRRDEESHRPRVNKPESVKDREQKKSGKLYYT
ncbi:ribosome biogenesis/translation initiation ATPase RLI [Candidatus Woesearchaeota archaeon]|nr:ribosome biogenesis/translation initiation ATPase RLI [Candidatus Woesearchaeota archaeon]